MAIDDPQPVPIPIYKGNTSPGIEDVIRIGNDPYDLTAQAVTFNMRLEDGTDTVLSGTATVDPDQATHTGRVTYGWSPGQTDDPGEYRFWWTVATPQGAQDTPEHPLVILEHAPGYDKELGAIAERLLFQLPATVSAMRSDPNYGDEGVQTLVDTVKLMVFGEAVPVREERTEYTALVLDWVAKVCAVRLIPAAIDYWGDRSLNVTVHGNTSESSTYPEKRDQLWKLLAKLRAEVGRRRPVLVDGDWVMQALPAAGGGIAVSTYAQWVTPDPDTFPRLVPAPNVASAMALPAAWVSPA